MKKKFMTIAAASLMSVGIAHAASTSTTTTPTIPGSATTNTGVTDPIVKCYGIAKAGANDCSSANASHGCAGQSTINNDPCEWKAVARSECQKGIKSGGKIIVGTEKPVNCKSSDPESDTDAAAEQEIGGDATASSAGNTSSLAVTTSNTVNTGAADTTAESDTQ
jgi:uncharacterized membrane protein